MSVILGQAIADERSASADPAGSRGRSDPLGATSLPGGVNFSVFSRNATGVELLLFDREDDPRPARVIPIHPAGNRTYHYWHLFVPGVQPGQLYGYRVHGLCDPASGIGRYRFRVVPIEPEPDPSSCSSLGTPMVQAQGFHQAQRRRNDSSTLSRA